MRSEMQKKCVSVDLARYYILLLYNMLAYGTLYTQRLGAPNQPRVDWHTASVLIHGEDGSREARVYTAGLGTAQ